MRQILFDFRSPYETGEWALPFVAPERAQPYDMTCDSPCCVCRRETEIEVICLECGEDVCCACYLGHVGACRERRVVKTTRRKSKRKGA